MADTSDSEDTTLMTSAMRQEKKKPDWSRFGLSREQQLESEKKPEYQQEDEEENQHFQHHSESNKNELFAEDQSSQSKPWYKANFFISEPVLFGTWDGVFTSCMINIFGVVIFLRTGWMVGNAGIGFSVLIILLTISVAMIAALSAIGVCERCKMESGGVYFLLSHVLGARIGASIGILYCFGQAVACSLYVVGFGESIVTLMHQENEWVARGIAIGVVLLLLGINVAGVKWVIRLQLVLLLILFVAVLDFTVGSFVHTDPANGFIGWRLWNLQNNTNPGYQTGQSFFTVFGVFFPTATGVFAGINMSGDLRNPSKSIPVGTVSAVGVSTGLYLVFAVVLGATCLRENLQLDYLIAEKVSIVGFLFLAGLYISSVSSCMGGLYGSPRILQSIALENVIPVMKVLGRGVSAAGVLWLIGLYVASLSSALGGVTGTPRVLQAIANSKAMDSLKVLGMGRGPNKVPVLALVVITLISLIFIFIGNVNRLGPIVTMPFMLTYAAVDYAYFALAMSFDKRKAREARFLDSRNEYPPTFDTTKLDPQGSSAVANGGQSVNYGAIHAKPKESNDLDNLFPEQRGNLQRQSSLGSPTTPVSPNDTEAVKKSTTYDKDSVINDTDVSKLDDTAELLGKKGEAVRPANTEITRQPRSFYSIFCNRWLSLFGAVASLVISFAIQWGYALANISVALLVFIYIGQANPGVFPGIAEFSLYEWICDGFKRCCRRGPPPPEQIVVTPNTPAMNTMAAQLTEDNEDFANRGRYHQSEVVKGENFDDYASD